VPRGQHIMFFKLKPKNNNTRSNEICRRSSANVSPDSLPLALERYVLRHDLMMIISKPQFSQIFEWL
jgi:hypothetical protein